jgi:hypothetical protein
VRAAYVGAGNQLLHLGGDRDAFPGQRGVGRHDVDDAVRDDGADERLVAALKRAELERSDRLRVEPRPGRSREREQEKKPLHRRTPSLSGGAYRG